MIHCWSGTIGESWATVSLPIKIVVGRIAPPTEVLLEVARQFVRY